MPHQFTPPVPPGDWIVERGGASRSLNMNGVNVPRLMYPPARFIIALHASTCSGVVSSGRTRSVSSLKLTRLKGRGRTGIGCVGEYHSVGTSPAGTGVS